MVKKEKISGSQLVFLLIPLITSTELMSVPGVIYQFAKEDAWISYLVSSLTAIWSIFVFTALAMRHPDMTFIEYSEKILGQWLGKIVGLFYMYYLFILLGKITDGLMSFITLFAQPQTPRLLTLGLFLIVCGIGAWLGLEVIARCSELLVSLSIIFIIIVSVLLLPEMVPAYLQPVLGHGMYPVFQGAVMPSAWGGEFFILGFLLPYLNDINKGRASAFVGLGGVMLVMLLVVLESILIGGPLTGQLKYAYYDTVRYVSIGDFLERIDPVILGVWVYNGFVKNAVVLWVFVLCTSQVFGIRNYQILVFPLTLLCIIGSLWTFSNAFELNAFLVFTFPIVGLLMQNVLPTLILVVDVIRSRKRGCYAKVAA